MAHITADRVRQTTTSVGTGSIVLSGSLASFRDFSAVLAVNDTFWYAIASYPGSEWEVGLGTYTSANTFTRTTVLSSSNAGAAVTFSAGTKEVFITAAASKFLQADAVGSYGNFTAGTITAALTGNASTATSVGSLTGIATVAPLVAGTAAVGTSTLGARQDHVHPVQTSVTGNAGTASKILFPDTRAVTTTPETLASPGVLFDFKQNTTESLSDGGTYFGEMTLRPYGSLTDWTGGGSHQLGFTNNSNIWHRYGTSTTWGSWVKLYDTADAATANTASTLVLRDASGNFSAGTITASLTGNASGSAATFTSTTQNSQFNSIGVGVAASTTAGTVTAPKFDIRRDTNTASGIRWYSNTYTAWQTYMSNAVASSGAGGNITAPAGTLVTSWALRNFVESTAGYGWTWESGTSTSTTPVVVAELRSSDGSMKLAGAISSPFHESVQTISTNYTITAGSNAMTPGPITIASGVTVTVPSGSVWTIV